MEVVGFLVADSMLSTHTTLVLTAEVHDEWINHLVEAGLSLRSVLVPFHGDVQVHVTVTDVTVPIAVDFRLLFSGEDAGLSDMLSSGLDDSVVGVSLE